MNLKGEKDRKGGDWEEESEVMLIILGYTDSARDHFWDTDPSFLYLPLHSTI